MLLNLNSIQEGDTDLLEAYDFTRSLNGIYHGVAPYDQVINRSASGLIFEANGDYISFPAPLAFNGSTIEIDVAAMDLSYDTYKDFVTTSHSRYGLRFESANGGGMWKLRRNNADAESLGITAGDYFANSTVKIIIDVDGYWHIYRNDVLVFESTIAVPVTRVAPAIIIGNINQSIDYTIIGTVITGMRFYKNRSN